MNGWRVDGGRVLAIGMAVTFAIAAPDESAAQDADTAPPIAAVQALLKKERLYTGPVDGAPSTATTAAIRRYQILHGLRATGLLDEATLRAMLAPAPVPKALADSDRELLRELAEAPIPDPVAEARREPIPPGPPVYAPGPSATPSPKAKREKPGRTRTVRHARPATSFHPIAD